MTIWAIVPVKPLRRGKSRLAGSLSNEQRTDLNRRLLEHTIGALSDMEEIGQILVVSRDPSALAIARERGARTLQEDGAPHLNTALSRATAVSLAHGAHGVLVLPADLPLLDTNDLRLMVKRARPTPSVIIAPDHRRDGTNALLISPPGAIGYEFGPGSFERHCRQAVAREVRLEVLSLPSLALDLDLPEDLALLDGLEGMKIK
ncbi:MAG: 2-phospho-L-lactate guanylyltransferase [Chloroflexi bacterium]|nr:2-phospho-L-lactate guanylyltransferase [Chloroflexota bacterium]